MIYEVEETHDDPNQSSAEEDGEDECEQTKHDVHKKNNSC
jgi:hypothetical protein